MKRSFRNLALLLLIASAEGAVAQTETVYREDFNSQAREARVPGWIETSFVGSIARRRAVGPPDLAGGYRVRADPRDANNGVFGIRSDTNFAGNDPRRTGVAATYPAIAGVRSAFTGRFYRSSDSVRVGLMVLSALPDSARHYLVASSLDDGSMRLFASGTTAGGAATTTFKPTPGEWIRFRIETDDVAGATSIRARFWRDGTVEPQSDVITVFDASEGRLLLGRIGVWSAGWGEALFDDFLFETTPVQQIEGPSVAIMSPGRGEVLTAARVDVLGRVDKSATVHVNGVAAVVDAQAKTFIARGIELSEGPGTITAIATDDNALTASATHPVVVDSRAPDLTIDTPSANACLSSPRVEIGGQVFDRELRGVRVSAGDAAVDAVVSGGRWTATVPLSSEGKLTIRVEARDSVDQSAAQSVAVNVDRTAPSIALVESGAPFAGGVVNRPLTFLATTTDASAATTSALLNGNAYTFGSKIESEGEHQLVVTAMDCAGNRSERTVSFIIDRTPPQILTMAPEHAATSGSVPRVGGTASADTVRVEVDPQRLTFPVTAGAFALEGLPIEEGENIFELVAVDRAGNESRRPYALTLRLRAPSVEILEDGTLIGSGKTFNRTVVPVIRSNDATATITATLNGQSFQSGTSVSVDGQHTITASAIDALGHRSETVTASFAIDRTPPAIAITEPKSGSIPMNVVAVRGTVSSDAVAVTVNGYPAALDGGVFSASVSADFGPTLIAATATDAAGNSASAHVEVERGFGPSILITAPQDGIVTNRKSVRVAGQVLSNSASTVSVAGTATPVDVTGAFQQLEVPLREGNNDLPVIATDAEGRTATTTIRVVVDRTPPHVRLLESGQPLQNGARFPSQAVLSIAVDGGDGTLFVDGAPSSSPVVVKQPGAHAVTAVARDAAGNESRLERTFFIGTSGAACSLGSFDPPHNAIVNSATVVLTGRSGSAAGVKVNGVAANVANGSFCATIELPSEGDNVLSVSCADSGGDVVGKPAILTLRRITGQPSIEIASPAEGAALAAESIAVSGSVSSDAVSVDVNGVTATIDGGVFSASSVRLSPGLNVIVARARNAANATISTSRRIVHLRALPSIGITSPPVGAMTGAASIDVTGTWQNLDPSTIAGATVVRWSDTSGTFVLPVALTTGANAITVSGTDAAGRTATANVNVTRNADGPAVSIVSPADNAFLPRAEGEAIAIEGTFVAAPGSVVEVNGAAATINGSSFSASVNAVAGNTTPVVVRVSEPDGDLAVDAIRVHRTSVAPAVLQTFPAAGATGIERGVLPLILFSTPMDRVSLDAALRLEASNGSAVSGTLRLDRDVVTFAPAALLTPGETYTLRLSTAARDLAGRALAAEHLFSFTIAPAASIATAPVLSAIPPRVCAASLTVTGTAPPNSRIRIDLGNLRFNATASAAGAFSYAVPLGGLAGFQVARARIVSSDGSESPAAQVCFLADCAGPRVVATSFDRMVNKLTVSFSKPLNAATVIAGSFAIRLPDGRAIATAVTLQEPSQVVVTPAEDLSQKSFTLTIAPTIEDAEGHALGAPYVETFDFQSDAPPAPGDGSGFIAGEVFDAGSGWPLAGASVTIGDLTMVTDEAGRYAAQAGEGKRMILASSAGHVTVWRGVVVPAGAGVVPIDIRLARRDPTGITPLDAQTLPGLLPLGWSPIAATNIAADVSPLPAEVSFTVPRDEVIKAAQTLAAVRYHDDRDEWRVLNAVVNIAADGRVVVPIFDRGTYALVYADAAPHLVRPPPPVTGAILEGVADPCVPPEGRGPRAGGRTQCPPVVASSFLIDPPSILPTGRATATLTIEGAAPNLFPSGTPVQAFIHEELRLADGTRVHAPPFNTDLVLHRSLAGDRAAARFAITPSDAATASVLEVGFSHVRIDPHPGSVARGSLIGPEGGRVPGDGVASVDVPEGATSDLLRASTAAIDAKSFGTIAGFDVVSAFELTLQRVDASTQPVVLNAPASVTLATSSPAAQHILAEIVDGTPFGRVVKLVARMTAIGGGRVTTSAIDREAFPIDGVIRPGRFLLLAAQSPIAFSYGLLRLQGGPLVRDASVRSSLGVSDVTGATGVFAMPVPAAPAPPFTLTPRTHATGDGATYTHAVAPEAGAVVAIGDLPLTIRPATVTSMFPANGATGVSTTTFVKATIEPSLDPTSIHAGSIVVFDSSMTRVAGNVAAEGTLSVVWTLPPGERLRPNAVYTAVVSPTVRSQNGALLGSPHTISFTTVGTVTNGEVRRERVRLTIPDANRRSRVIGTAGALPAGWLAVPVRRGTDFATRYQGAAANDGSFTIAIAEPVDLRDRIDLQIINSVGALAAIFELTPFVTEDGRTFAVRADEDTRFVSPDGVVVHVPGNAFGGSVTIETTPSTSQDVAHVPNIAAELRHHAGIRLAFDGEPAKRIDVEFPVPQGLDTSNRQFVLGHLGDSVRGARMMIVDTLRVEDGRFTTRPSLQAASLRSAAFSQNDLKGLFHGIESGGTFGVFSFDFPPAGPAWAILDSLGDGFDLFWDAYASLFVSAEFIADHRRVAIPVPRGRQFEVVGVDASTGLQGFAKVYDPLPVDDPGVGYALPSPNPDAEGPHPVFGTPFRVEAATMPLAGVNVTTVRHFVLRLSNGEITATDDAADRLPPSIEASLLNVSRGFYDNSRNNGLSVPGEIGDRVVLLIGQADVDPQSSVSIVFSEPLWTGPDANTTAGISAYLASVVRVARREGASWQDVTAQVFFRLDSGDRRLLIDLPALQRGASYRVSLLPALVDASDPAGEGMRIGQALVNGSPTPPLAEPVQLSFNVRAPGGPLTSFDVANGSIRDLALNGNLLFVAALDGGLVAYDTSDPAGLTSSSVPMGVVEGAALDYWAIASDHHGRVFATGLTTLTGALQTFGLEQFIDRSRPAPRVVTPKSGALISWAPGASVIGEPAGDRPVGIPRKINIVLMDDDDVYESRAAFVAATGASETPLDRDFAALTVSIAKQATQPYLVQRITIENMTLDLRWSADAAAAPARFDEVIARPGDRMRVIYNERTYAVVTIFGYGVAVYDVNAMESNDHEPKPPGYERPREQIRATRGALRPDGEPASNPCGYPDLTTAAIRDLTFAPEAAILTRPGLSDLEVFALDANRGLLDLAISPPDGTPGPPNPCERGPMGLVFRGSRLNANPPHDPVMYDHPRLIALRTAFEGLAGRQPFARFNSIAHYRWRLEAQNNAVVRPSSGTGNAAQGARGSVAGTLVERDYLLIAGNEYGLLIAEAGGTAPIIYPSYRWMEPQHFVDLVWVPTGVAAVRAIPRTNLAVVIDGRGHAVLVDLSRIDERWDAAGTLQPTDALFASATKALAGGSTWGGFGTPDPRIVWRSDSPVAFGTLAPVVDPDTGIVFAGALTQKKLNVLAAIDPRVQVKVDLAAANGLSEVGGIVPLGVDPPQSIRDLIQSGDPDRRPNASLGAFRVEVTIPGGLPEVLNASNNRLHIAVENERVPNAVTEQLPAPYPRAHLRSRTRSGASESRPATGFYLDRVLPSSIPASRLRHQRGFNKYVSQWIVAVADPRASASYAWPANTSAADKIAAGCFNCERPLHLRGKTEADGVWELFASGRFITVRPDFCGVTCATNLFTGTPYEYLGGRDRMVARFASVMADTLRPPEVTVAAQNPPVAIGALQETTFVHSGELETSTVDLDAGGRNGWNVAFDRTYRSRSIGHGVLGAGWEANMNRRLRPLPNGDVEYRDEAGETWRFALLPTGKYAPTRGLFLGLTRTQNGWRLTDSKSRVTDFDSFGRIITESDEFADDPARTSRGNIIRYLYGTDGRLAQIIDPVGRASTLTYFADTEPGLKAGRLREIVDWRDRSISFDYDAEGRLTKVALPNVANTNGRRPEITYGYASAASDLASLIEKASNLTSITDPAAPTPRITVAYDATTDRVQSQRWATGESAAFTFPSPNTAVVTDVLGQRRTYTMSAQPRDFLSLRAQVTTLEEHDVLTSIAAVGVIPPAATPSAPPRALANRKFVFEHDADGLLLSSRLEGVYGTTFTYAAVPNAPGRMLTNTRTQPEGPTPGIAIDRKIEYQPGNAFVQSVDAGGVKINAAEAHRANGDTVVRNDEIDTTTSRDDAGRIESVVSAGGTDPVSGSDTRFRYLSDSGPMHARGLLRETLRPGLTPVRHDYPDRNRITTVDERNVVSEVKLDEWERPTEVTQSGPGLTFQESSEFDAAGRLRKHRRVQGTATVTTDSSYDSIGRPIRVSTDNVSIDGAPAQAVATTAYDLAQKKITRTLPGGAVIEESLDSLGRVTTRTTTTGNATPIIEEFAYDLAGNLVWHADNHLVTSSAFDAHGNRIATVDPSGVRTTTAYDAWNRPTLVETFSKSGAKVASSAASFSAAGRLQASSTLVDTNVHRDARSVWDGGGRMTGAEVEGRVARTRFDAAGRLQSSLFGGGSLAAPVPMHVVTAGSHDGRLVTSASVAESSGAALPIAASHDTAGNIVQQSVGALSFRQTFDQAGNAVSSQLPGRPAEAFDYDARGAMTGQTLADGSTIGHRVDASGAETGYRDQTNEVTESINDHLGRPRARTYADGTTETFEYDGARLLSKKDRQGRSFSYAYDKERLIEIRGSGGVLLDQFEYDDAGRLTKWRTADAVLEWSDFDFEARPRKTTQTRIDAAGNIIDTYVQQHEWNVHGERASWTMPSYTGFASTAPWTVKVIEGHDAAGNVDEIDRVVGASQTVLMRATYRNARRPDERGVTTFGSNAPIVRTYGYNTSGQMSSMSVTARGVVVAGSSLAFDGLQVAAASLLGVSGGVRANEYTYDERGRLTASSFARESGAVSLAQEVLTPADFRLAHERTSIEPGEPPSLAFTESPGHKINALSRGGDVFTFAYGGAERVDDGRFVYEYDFRGRMIRATEKVGGGAIARRVTYFYAGNNRVVGRRAEYGPAGGPWRLEDRADVIDGDGIAPDVTLVWDAVTDRIAAIFRTGSSANPSIDSHGGLLRQFIHGGLGYDDPVEVAVAGPANGGVHRLYPVFEEAGAGNLQVVLNSDGEVIARSLAQDPYNAEESALAGAGVDKIEVAATKASGTLQSVRVDVRFTEELDGATIAGAGIAQSGVAPQLVDGFTLRWTFDAAASASLPSLDIKVTNDLRAKAWSASSPILPPPDWALATKPVFTSDEIPFEYRESRASLTAWIATIAADETRTTTLYEVENLATLDAAQEATPDRLLNIATFQALPFSDPATGLVYARSRWLDLKTGTFLSPDRAGYLDSSNLYAFAAGDPINGRDPTGDCLFGWGGTCAEWATAGKKRFEHAKKFVDQHTDAGVLGIAVNATVATVLDAVDVIVLDVMRAGDATGTAIGSGAGAGGVALSVVQDVGRAAALAGGAGTAVKTGVSGVSALGRGAQAVRAAYRASVISSEVGSVGAGVRNVSAAQTAMRARVLANIEASGAARNVSKFKDYATEDLYARAMHFAETGDFATPYGRAIFYSGRGAQEAVNVFKRANPGYMTIEETITGSLLDAERLYERLGPKADDIWRVASRRYAEAARGRVRIFDRYADPTRLFKMVEEPILNASRRVWGLARHWDY